MPGVLALISCSGWLAAALIWGVAQPLFAGDFEPRQALRRMFGIAFVAGSVVTAITYLGSERLLREEMPALFPDGRLSAVRAPRPLVRTRLVAVFLLVGLLPLAPLAVAALTRTDALRVADAASAAVIMHNLKLLIVVVALGGVAVSVSLAFMVAASVGQLLRELQLAMREVQRGRLDTQCAVVSNDEIGAATREVTVLFADLNAYFSRIDAAIRAHGGLVLQYIGDEIEAVFGAPQDNPRHADAAVAAAREMSARLDEWNLARTNMGKQLLRHGIGIHTGTVIAGNIGSAERQSYALVGDAVNVASRIQSLNKEFGTRVLVSGNTPN